MPENQTVMERTTTEQRHTELLPRDTSNQQNTGMTRERFGKAAAYFKQLTLLRADSNQKIMVDQLQPLVFYAFSEPQQMDNLFNAYIDWQGYQRSTGVTGLFNSRSTDEIRKNNGQLADSLPFLFDWLTDIDSLIRTDLKNPREVFKDRVNDQGKPLNQFTEEMLQAADEADKAVGVMRSNVGVDPQHVADTNDVQRAQEQQQSNLTAEQAARQTQQPNPPVHPYPSNPPSGMVSHPPNAPNPQTATQTAPQGTPQPAGVATPQSVQESQPSAPQTVQGGQGVSHSTSAPSPTADKPTVQSGDGGPTTMHTGGGK